MPSLAQLLGVDIPLIQAPMAGAQDARLAVAVASAGALGSLPCATLGPDALHTALSELAKSGAPSYNLNFFCHTAPEPDPEREAAWRALLAPYYEELGLDPREQDSPPSRRPFDAAAADIVEEFRPRVVSFHFGLPSPELLARVRSWGSVVLSTATTVDEAVLLERHGVDAIIAQGIEAGGHRGFFLSTDLDSQLGTFALLPQLVRAVRVPVIAAGGIVDARTVSAALALGAAGVQVGTAYLLCPESTTSAVHRAALESDRARGTAITNLFSGGPARGIVNRLMRELGPMSAVAPPFPLAAAAVAPLRSKAEREGRGDFSPLWCGMNASGCRAIAAAELTRTLGAAL
jgi:nitronate monooxygenase